MKKYLKFASAAFGLIALVMMFFTQVVVKFSADNAIGFKALVGGEYTKGFVAGNKIRCCRKRKWLSRIYPCWCRRSHRLSDSVSSTIQGTRRLISSCHRYRCHLYDRRNYLNLLN